MIISILGGTGSLGKGLAMRLAIAGYEVVVGSRDEERAISKAREYEELCGHRIRGMSNKKAIEICDVAILTIPWENVLDFVREHRILLSERIVVSPIVPMKREGNSFIYAFENESMAERIAEIVEGAVVSAFHNVPAKRFSNLEETPNFDIVVCGDDVRAKKVVMEIVNSVKNLRALDGGPLSNSRVVERLTPFIINVAIANGLKEIGIKFI